MTTHRFGPRTEIGPVFNEGARLLWLVLAAQSLSQGALCRLIALDKPGAQSRWLWGDTRPTYFWRKKLLKLFAISLDAWDEAPTEAFVPPALAEESDVMRDSPPPTPPS